MNRQEEQTWQAPPCLTSKRIVLPTDIILYMAKFLSFVDYRNLIRSLWPNGGGDEIFREKLWRMSTYTATTRFINGEQLIIEYNYDPLRREGEQMLINMDSLSAVFGGIFVPAGEKFVSIEQCKNFVEMHVHLDLCSHRRHASCPCHIPNLNIRKAVAYVKPPFSVCEYGHYHHYCSQHVRYWMNFFMDSSILLGEEGGKRFFDFLDTTVYFKGTEMKLRDPHLNRMM